MDLDEIKIKEIKVFLELLRSGSVRELARQRSVHAGQISKIINSLEGKMGFKLIERSPFGVKATNKAQEVLPLLNEIYKQEQNIKSNFKKTKEKPVLGFGSTSFFSTHLLPELFAQFEDEFSDYKIRLMDLPPDLFMPVALRNGFQLCLHLQDLDWPKTWTSEPVGEVRWILCCRRRHPVLKTPVLSEVLKYPFVFPIYWTHEGLAYGNDNFPVTAAKRIKGFETTTATSAVELVRLTDQLGFVPEIVAQPLLDKGEIEQLKVPGLKEVSAPVFLSVKNDRISQKMFVWMMRVCAEKLK